MYNKKTGSHEGIVQFSENARSCLSTACSLAAFASFASQYSAGFHLTSFLPDSYAHVAIPPTAGFPTHAPRLAPQQGANISLNRPSDKTPNEPHSGLPTGERRPRVNTLPTDYGSRTASRRAR